MKKINFKIKAMKKSKNEFNKKLFMDSKKDKHNNYK